VKLLSWNCVLLEYRDRAVSTRPEGVGNAALPPQSGHFENVLVVFTCVEVQDDANTVVRAAEAISDLATQMGRSEIALVPFGHLSSALQTDSAVAVGLINSLASSLRVDSLAVTLTSFGYHKDFELHFKALGHAGAVAFRDL